MAIRSVRAYGPTGLANVKVEKDKVIVELAESHQMFSILKEDAPENIISGKYFITMNVEGTKISNVRPPKGTYFAKFKEFSHKKDEPARFRDVPADVRRRKDGTVYAVRAHLEFTAIFEIIKGEFKGFHIPYNMWYCFKPSDIQGETDIYGQGRQDVEEFIAAVGFDVLQDSIPYSDNILPALQEMIHERNREVVIVINDKGYVDSMAEAPKE